MKTRSTQECTYNSAVAADPPATHKVAAFPGRYIQGEGTLNQLPGLIARWGGQGLILASPSAVNKVLRNHPTDFTAHETHIETFRGECCEPELERVAGLIRKRKSKVIVGMGGGKTIDTAKIAADTAGLPVIIVPTIASTDAPCSGCAVVYSPDGVFQRVFYQKSNPQMVLVDTRVIANAPTRFLVAGMGDALSTWFEARSCHRTHSRNECGGLSTLTGLALAELCYETLLAHGPAAKTACSHQVVTPALERIVEANILLSGIGFESSGLATAHSVHNGLSALAETHAFFHGEKVAIGVLTGLHLTDAPPSEMAAVYAFCETIGLPTTLEEIGITEDSPEYLLEAATKACAPAEGIHHEAGTITPSMVRDALIAADAMGRARKHPLPPPAHPGPSH